MASSVSADKPKLPAPHDAMGDPFISSGPPPAHHRYSNFDVELFAAGPGSSPRQAKRALEAHLAETDRRLDEAGKLGTALVSQRKALAERLQDVEKLQAEGDLGPELRTKLFEIEKEYNDLARDTARAFLPKQRVPSNEANPGTPHAPEGRSGRRSVSPSKFFESQATGSPTKLTVPNRKIRNQPANRVHDIEFAAEISTSLIAQVRSLQALLAEREEEVKDLTTAKSTLEIETENLHQRIKALDESEHRYKEENWNLETRLQELTALQKEAADREKKLTQALNVSQAEKNSTQKELDDAKLQHSKLAEEHAAAVKQHDIELGTAKRNMVAAESERTSMQRKIDDLVNQNSELAKAFSAQRGRPLDREAVSGMSDEDFETATDNVTPEHSPPPSPVKGTPRHSILETETMKSSLHHAQRTIQSQRSQIHREKTEKLELRRMIQDLRDELEKSRNDAGGSSRRSRKVESKELRKPPRLLGNLRSSKEEIHMDDVDWEDGANMSPRDTSARMTHDESSERFDTANEASESAFETANERGTETEDFQTGNEDYQGSDDDAETETETTSRGFGRMRRPPSLPAGMSKAGNRESFHSTASTSADEDDMLEAKTPTTSLSTQRSRFRLSRGPLSRTARQASDDQNMRSSPASIASSVGGTPKAGQSLFAELQDFNGSDEESVGAMTPSRRSTRSATPGSTRRQISPRPAVPELPRVVMVDSGVMTEPVEISLATPARGNLAVPETSDRPASMESAVDTFDACGRPLSTASYSDAGAQYEPDLHAKLAQFPVPPTSPPAALSLTSIQAETVEPREEVQATPTRPALSLSSITAQGSAPVAEPIIPPPPLTMTTLQSETVEPIASPEIAPPPLALSSISTEAVEPVAERELAPVPVHEPVAPTLGMTSIIAQNIDPVSEPMRTPPSLTLSSIASETVEPVSPATVKADFGFSTIESIETRPASPRSFRRDGFILPRDKDSPQRAKPETPNRSFGALLGWAKSKDTSPVIAEDETRQSPRDTPEAETPESQRPFKEISSNSNVRQPRKQSLPTNDQSAQTALTGDVLDQLFETRPRAGLGHEKKASLGSVGTPGTTGTVRINRLQEDSFGSPSRGFGKAADEYPSETGSIRRPSSAHSGKASLQDAPPLPPNHRELIEAARTGSSGGPQSSMGPPLWPASAMKHRPRTPSLTRPMSSQSGRGTPTPRAVRIGSTSGHAEVYGQPKLTARSRQSSVSSFASELDTRFNMRPGEMGMDPTGLGPNTDPRMIQAITQTMIGEYLWKYTRKAGRGGMSEKRHRRYFWVHPYTRTLYWSDRDPSSAGRAELKAKSVPIEAVRVVTDDNPMPPGLHRKSLIIISPGRTVKFTCQTGQRHETWFNALSYLLLRTNNDGQNDAEELAGNITREDVEEFNPQYGQRPANGTRPRPPPSLSSYNSRASRNVESPAQEMPMDIPTLTPTANRGSSAQRPSAGTFSRLSGYWRSGGPKFSSFRSRAGSVHNASIYEASEVHDSAEDLRAMIEQQDREADRLENVRACCDGKHDVGMIPHHSKRGRHSHAHPHSSTSTPMASTRSRT